MKTVTRSIAILSGILFSTSLLAQDYCIPPGFKPMGGSGEPFTYISNVKLENLNNNSGMPTGTNEDNGYTYFNSATVPVLQQGMGYSLKVSAVDNLGAGMEVIVWIDWNGDKVFDASSERVAHWFPDGDHGTDIMVPANAPSGIVRMRVYCDMPPSMGHIPGEPCGYLNYPSHAIGQHGEVEDYDLQIGGATGIELNDRTSMIDLYPVPANNILNVNHDFQEALPYTVVDLYGRTVMQGKLESGNNILNVSDLRSGQYVMVVQENNKPIYKTFFIAQ